MFLRRMSLANGEENALTEFLAELLRDPELRRHFLLEALGWNLGDAIVSISTQGRSCSSGNQPDVELSVTGEARVLIENKVWAAFGDRQLERYAKELVESTLVPEDKIALLVLAPSVRNTEVRGYVARLPLPVKVVVVTWESVATWMREAARAPVSAWLAAQFADWIRTLAARVPRLVREEDRVILSEPETLRAVAAAEDALIHLRATLRSRGERVANGHSLDPATLGFTSSRETGPAGRVWVGLCYRLAADNPCASPLFCQPNDDSFADDGDQRLRAAHLTVLDASCFGWYRPWAVPLRLEPLQSAEEQSASLCRQIDAIRGLAMSLPSHGEGATVVPA